MSKNKIDKESKGTAKMGEVYKKQKVKKMLFDTAQG